MAAQLASKVTKDVSEFKLCKRHRSCKKLQNGKSKLEVILETLFCELGREEAMTKQC